jgi:hypothetical protein
MDSGILMIQDSILVCSPDPRIPHTALYLLRLGNVIKKLHKINACVYCSETQLKVLVKVHKDKERYDVLQYWILCVIPMYSYYLLSVFPSVIGKSFDNHTREELQGGIPITKKSRQLASLWVICKGHWY